ncbi:MAG: ABC transporter permease [Thermaerobacter sp.]|nr:ABC transporter permease [Thermaerobacter sp.]
MARYVVRRLLIAIPTLIGVTVVVFLMVHLIPGNIVQIMLGTRTNVSAGQLKELYRLYGINSPLYLQYWLWFSALLHGNLGFSLRSGLPISSLISQSFVVTAELALGALMLAIVVAIPLGMVAALHQRGVLDWIARGFALIGLAIPNFWLGTLLVLGTSIYLPSFSAFNYVSLFSQPVSNLRDMLFPIVALALSLMAIITRMTRAAVLESLKLDHVRTAYAKGLTPLAVNVRHVLRNGLIPITTIIGLQLGYLLGGAIVVENVFSLPGMGQLVVNAINQRDYPVVQSSVLIIAVVFILVNLVVDISYGLINPTIRYQ